MENRINIGQMDRVVSVLKPTMSIGTEGQKISTYTKHSDVFAFLEENTDENVAYYNQEMSTSMVATIYKIDDLTTRWRISIGGKKYEIISIDPVSRVSRLCRLNLRSID